MTLATPAPHAPFTPAPRHKHFFPNVKAVKSPSFNYSDDMVSIEIWLDELGSLHFLETLVD